MRLLSGLQPFQAGGDPGLTGRRSKTAGEFPENISYNTGMDAETDKELKLLFKDAGFETEKTVARFDVNELSVNIYFKRGMGYPDGNGRIGRGGLDVAGYLKANGLLAAELINRKYYCPFDTFLQIFLPPAFGLKIMARLGGKPERSGTSF